MPKADETTTTPPPPLTSGKTALALSATIDRLKQIAGEAMDHLYLSDGPPQPDYELLDICSDILHGMKQIEALWKQIRNPPWRSKPMNYQVTDADRDAWRPIDEALHAKMKPIEGNLRSLFSQARNLQATTGAGIYAKALVCRHSATGAAKMAMSLAEDLVASPQLRASLWGDEGSNVNAMSLGEVLP